MCSFRLMATRTTVTEEPARGVRFCAGPPQASGGLVSSRNIPLTALSLLDAVLPSHGGSNLGDARSQPGRTLRKGRPASCLRHAPATARWPLACDRVVRTLVRMSPGDLLEEAV